MICIQLDNKFDWFGISNICGDMWSNRVVQSRERDEERDEDFVKEGFQLTRVKFDRNGEESSR